ncbi:hypothetical protein Sste5344_009167 [Sporothrix stenoceras]
MAFSFVNYEGPTLPKDPGVRKTIRRQAMRDVAVDRRTRGRYGQANRLENLRQYPVFVHGFVDIDDQTKMSKDKTKSKDASSRPGRLRLGIGMLSSVKSDLVRVRAGEPLSISASALGNPKLAHFIISRYGDLPALRYATDCIVNKLRQVLMRSRGCGSPLPHYEKEPLLLYNQALRAVQAALEDDTLRLTEETLCATELLAMLELLDENIPSWMHHASGAAQLIQFRGAHRFNTESGMTLFMANIGTTVMDAILGNKACFLEEAAWKELMRTVIRNDASLVHLRDISLDIWNQIVTGPRKFKAVTDAIASPTPLDRVALDTIIQHLMEDRASLLGWMERAKQIPGLRDGDFEVDEYGIIFPRPSFERDDSSPDRVTFLALWGTNIMCRILKTRLLVAMAPAWFRTLELECQYLAAKIVSLDQITTANNSSRKGVLQTSFISQSTWIVKGVIETKDIWAEGQDSDGGENMIETWKFEAWC